MILISGGYPEGYQLVKYEISNDDFVDYGEYYLLDTLNSTFEHGFGTYFTQISTTLYTINCKDYINQSINVYDLQSLSYQPLNTTIPVAVSSSGCISSSESPSPKLFLTGGGSIGSSAPPLKNLQILSLIDLQWETSPPSMLKGRWGHGCIMVNDRLWAIGGYNEDSVEAIKIADIAKESWGAIGKLSCLLWNMGVTAVNEIIFVVGGYRTDTDRFSDTVYTIDTNTNLIGVSADSLPLAVSGMSVVTIDRTIYGFGGLDRINGSDGVYLDSWMTFDVSRAPSQKTTFISWRKG